MTQVEDPIAETTIVVKKKNNEPAKVKVKIGRPVLGADRDGEPSWQCHVQIDGLDDFIRPVTGVSSFHALTEAISNVYSMFHIAGLDKARFSETGSVLGDEIWPDPGVKLVEFLGFDVAID